MPLWQDDGKWLHPDLCVVAAVIRKPVMAVVDVFVSIQASPSLGTSVQEVGPYQKSSHGSLRLQSGARLLAPDIHYYRLYLS